MLRSILPAALLFALGAAHCAFAAADAAASQNSFGNYTITVAPDPDSTLTGVDFQITVRNEDLLLARMNAPYSGTLSKSFVADLNHDGAFEVVITYTEPTRHATGIKVYSWQNDLLQPVKLADLDDSQRQGYRGDDEVAIVDGKLIRLFQVYEQQGDEWAATAAQRKLHYSFESGRWIID